MDFSIGEIIVYGSNGVCKIDDIKETSFFKEPPKTYYFLSPLFVKSSSVIYVPLDNPAQAGKIQPIMTEKEADEFIKSLPVTGMEWIEDRNRRKEAFSKVLSSGTRSDIAALIELIISHRKLLENEGRKLNAQDERALDEAMRRIDNELAIIKGVEPHVIQEQIIGLIDAV